MQNPDKIAVSLVESNDAPVGTQLVSSYQTNRNADPMDLVTLAQQVQKADDFIRANAGNKLMVIADQIHYLQEQARKILEEAKHNAMLNHAACNMVKRPGSTYYLYERPTGQKYFSLISPQEWGSSCPHAFINAYRLEYDMSWTSAQDFERRITELAMIEKVLHLNTQQAIMNSGDILGNLS